MIFKERDRALIDIPDPNYFDFIEGEINEISRRGSNRYRSGNSRLYWRKLSGMLPDIAIQAQDLEPDPVYHSRQNLAVNDDTEAI